MKYLIYLLTILVVTSSVSTLKAQEDKNAKDIQEIETANVEVYYFHNTRRCATCQAVEDVTKEALNEYYPDQMKTGTVNFQSIDIEKNENKALAEKLEISGQTLLIVKDGKKNDLTNDAFMYATSKPDKLKSKIHKAVGTI